MTRNAQRLAELDAISRARPLSDAEQTELLWRDRAERHRPVRIARYANDPDYRERERERCRLRARERMSDPAFREARNAARRRAPTC
jgi:hypothetical protein